MRASERFRLAELQRLRDTLMFARTNLTEAQRELQRARNRLVLAVSTAEAAGLPEEDLEILRATKAAIGDSLAGDQLRELEARVALLCERAKTG